MGLRPQCSGDGHEYDLAPVYFIGLLNTGIPKSDRSDESIWGDRFVSEYTFREKVSQEVVDETIFLNFVELHRFKKELHDCVSLVDKWCYSLKHVGSLDRLPEELRVRAFERLFEACETNGTMTTLSIPPRSKAEPKVKQRVWPRAKRKVVPKERQMSHEP